MRRAVIVLTAVAALTAAAGVLAAPPRVQAEAYLVQNTATGEVLASRHAREPLPVASITKLMTVLVTLERARLDEVVTVTKKAAAVGESTIDLTPGERITVADLVRAALVQSANDAATALALHVGRGSVPRFVGLMNAKARELGLADTHFVNPDGLDEPGHVSSARDVTRLARVAMRNPFVQATVRLRSATIAGGRTLHTWNDLLATFPSLIGVKTGHTDGAGWSEVAAARGPGVTIYATVLGGPSRERRNEDLASLLRFGLSRYRTVAAIDVGRVYATARTAYGRPPVPLVSPRSLRRVVHVWRPLVERVVAPVEVALPVRKGQRLGEVRVYAQGKLVASAPLLAARSVEKPGLRDRAEWYAGRTFHHLWGLVS